MNFGEYSKYYDLLYKDKAKTRITRLKQCLSWQSWRKMVWAHLQHCWTSDAARDATRSK